MSAAVHRHISVGNKARDRHDWPQATAAYRQALKARPDLVHIRIQLGHVLRETAHWPEAEAEYGEALRQDPANRDAGLALGHLLKQQRRWPEAARCYVEIAAHAPDDSEAMREARSVLGYLDEPARRGTVDRLIRALASFSDDGHPPECRADRCDVVFDISDLVSYFSHSRRPTGIQRVQIETLIHLLGGEENPSPDIGVCSFVEGRDDWVPIAAAPMLRLARLSLAGEGADDDEWARARDRLFLILLIAEPVRFRRGATLVNLGTSWWLRNYFLRLRATQTERQIIYIPMIHDVIPAILPELCLDALVQDFVAWALGVFAHATRFLANSQSTKRDFIALAARLGREIDPDDVAVVRLDGRYGAAIDPGTRAPASPGDDVPFVLLVGTIEPRKGHLTAFDAWERLLATHGADRVPRLVCVGRKGWRDSAILARLTQSVALAASVVLLSDIGDEALAALYDRCLFTIYPSYYEGWGLPVTEALCRGKMVITTTSASLPEAGGSWAVYVEPYDAAALAEAAAALIFDDERRLAGERRIAETFVPRDWSEIARDLHERADELRRSAVTPVWPPFANPSVFYWFGRSMALEPRREDHDGESYRSGMGWQSPAECGCRVKPGAGTLSFRVPTMSGAPPRRLTVLLRLIGSDHARCWFSLRSEAILIEGVLGRHERRSVELAIDDPGADPVTIVIAGSTDHVRHDEDPAAPAPATETVRVEGFMVTTPTLDTLS